MQTEILIIIGLFSISLTAFIGAINSKGTPRVVLSYILASIILFGSLYALFSNFTEKELAEKMAENAKYEQQLKEAEEEAKLASEQQAGVESEMKYKAELTSIITKGSSIARAISSIDVDNEDSDYDALISRSVSLKRQAYGLKKQFEKIKGEKEYESVKPARTLIAKAVRNLTTSANYFNLYFKAEDEDEEDERYDIFSQNAKVARINFSKAADKLK